MSEDREGGLEHTSESLERLRELARPIARGARFRKESILARGGMGLVHLAQDKELNRTLALKELAVGPAAEHALAASRFLEEAQITAQLDHPGILPVHELGVDEKGHLFFAMKLVQGRDLRAIFDLVGEQREGWTQTRALGVLLKVCEAMGYAHSKGVIHRDLKPGNVMVGHFGEVYVMDWGLARAMGREDVHDIRIKLDQSDVSVHTERREEREETPDSPLITMDGVVVGTPAYMPPEQARGEIHLLSPRSDVYSIGAMLYDLLTGWIPYVPRGSRASKYAILARVVEGPPPPITRLNPDAPPELVAICDKAMARDPEQRYPDTLALADDLRAYLEHRVVRAHQTGAWAELSKWVERNRALAGAIAAAVVALVTGLVASSILYVEARENEQRASANEQRARDEALAASQRAEEVLRLSAFQKLDDLVREADGLWPVSPELAPRYSTWLASAAKLTAQLPSFEATLSGPRPGAPGAEPASASLSTEEDRWWHSQLTKLVEELRAFADADTGLFSSGLSASHGWGVKRRLELASSIAERSLRSPEARAKWAEAIASIRDEDACPWYKGLELAPQLGLLPLGQDPQSWLWEFALLESGDPPVRDPDGELILTKDTAVVLVLLPGGSFRMGAQRSAGANQDPLATMDEGPVREVKLSPFFLSKFEFTLGQWRRVAGDPKNRDTDPRLPVVQVSWIACNEVCRRLGLSLPSEAQWEYAARGGTDTPWWSGADPALLFEVANLADASYRADWKTNETEDWQDNVSHLAHVGSFAANPFGLHDVLGNVWEWCMDSYQLYPERSPALDPVVLEEVSPPSRVLRGGAMDSAAEFARASLRFSDSPGNAGFNLGFRPARKIMP